jgi:hypothetical protein
MQIRVDDDVSLTEIRASDRAAYLKHSAGQ